jgi:8-oxo-dGTP pyrophosphatase MutT (NUDIX family)
MSNAPTLVDRGYQAAYRLAFPLAKIWWHIRRPPHNGALAAVHVGPALLLLRSSYRSAWNFPGGSIQPHETPEAAVRRELAEEIGLSPAEPLRPAGEAGGDWDGRRDRVFFFALDLPALPPLRLDNREIIGARLVPLDELGTMTLTGPVAVYVSRLGIPGIAADRR